MIWDDFINKQTQMPYFQKLMQAIESIEKNETVFPPVHQRLRAFEMTPFEKVKVVIVGQDPYHGFNQANGLSFSVNPGVTLPKSLINIFKELESDCGITNLSGDLSNWAKQGVLLLNTTLSVSEKKPLSHRDLGWESFTKEAIKTLCKSRQNLIFILWGNHARQFEPLAQQYGHTVLYSTHPSPLSAYRGFFGSKPFSKVNKLLIDMNETPIDWSTNYDF